MAHGVEKRGKKEKEEKKQVLIVAEHALRERERESFVTNVVQLTNLTNRL